MVVNAAGKLEPSLPEIAEVAGDGTAYDRQRFIGTFVEPLDLRAFPFDSATFGIRFVAIGNRPADLLFVPNEALVVAGLTSGSGVAPQLTLQDWRLTGYSARDLP